MKTPFTILALQHGSLFEAYGGVEYYLHDLMSLLGEALGRDEVHTLIPLRKKTSKIGKTIYQTRTVSYSAFGPLLKIQNRFSWKYFQAAKEMASELMPDLILASHVSMAPMAWMLSRLYKTPYAVATYGIDIWGPLWKHDRFALLAANSVLTISEWTKQKLIERGVPADKIGILHPMLAPSFENETPKTVFRNDGPLQLLSISRLDSREQYKGQDHVLEALALLKKNSQDVLVHYTIQGDGTDKPRLQEMALQLGLESIVTFKDGVKSRGELANSYRDSDVFILPSRFGENQGEGFGIVYVEAGALGVPSIAYRCGGALDIILDGTTGWLAEPNVTALAQCIRECAENRGEIARRGKEARKHVVATFNKAAIAKELEINLSRWQERTIKLGLPELAST